MPFCCHIRLLKSLSRRCHSERSEESRPENKRTARFLVACGPTENRVIPAEAGIHCVPERKWTPAFAGVTARMIFIRSGGLQAHGYNSE
jgi:hypothetical protein